MEMLAFPPLFDICRPSGTVRDSSSYSTGFQPMGSPSLQQGIRLGQRSRSLGSFVWATNWAFLSHLQCGQVFPAPGRVRFSNIIPHRGVQPRGSCVWVQGNFRNLGGRSHKGTPDKCEWRKGGQDRGEVSEALAKATTFKEMSQMWKSGQIRFYV